MACFRTVKEVHYRFRPPETLHFLGRQKPFPCMIFTLGAQTTGSYWAVGISTIEMSTNAKRIRYNGHIGHRTRNIAWARPARHHCANRWSYIYGHSIMPVKTSTSAAQCFACQTFASGRYNVDGNLTVDLCLCPSYPFFIIQKEGTWFAICW